jgi:hypothetical protein
MKARFNKTAAPYQLVSMNVLRTVETGFMLNGVPIQEFHASSILTGE